MVQREEDLDALQLQLKTLDPESEEHAHVEDQFGGQLAEFTDRQMAVSGEYRPMLPGRVDTSVLALLKQYAADAFDPKLVDADGKPKFENHQAMQAHDLQVVRLPYVVIGLVVIGMLVVFAVSKLPKAGGNDRQIHFFETLYHLGKNYRYIGGVIAQTFYVGAQIMCWTYIIHYAMINLNMTLSQAQRYNIVAMIIFCSSRFVCTYLLKYVSPGGLLMFLSLGGMALSLGTIFIEGMLGLYCLIGISACMSLMFPTIYGIALDGLGDEAKLGSAGLIFAIVGGALMPRWQGRIIDMGDYFGNLDVGFTTLPAVSASFVLPLICFVVIAVYGLLTVKPRPKPVTTAEVAE